MKYRVVEDSIGLERPRFWLESSLTGEDYWSPFECLDSKDAALARMAAHMGTVKVVAKGEALLENAA